MPVDLRDLLRSHHVVHPSRILSADLSNGGLRLFITGYPWWLDKNDPVTEEAITFDFTGVSEGSLDLADVLHPHNNEALDRFEVCSLTDIEWALPDAFQIFCHEPLPDPVALYSKLQDYLRMARAIKGARHFLNVDSFPGRAGALSRFTQVVKSQSYLIARGPERVRQVICEELHRQSVSSNTLPLPDKSDDRLLVRLGCSWFYCVAAVASAE
jgi:hypothetical protein